MSDRPLITERSQTPDFVGAHRRHWDDGKLLCEYERWANAAYLLGFSAECGLKAVMRALGWMHLDATGIPQEDEHRKHIQELWPTYVTLARDRDGARYDLGLENLFCDWSHHDRYASGQHVSKKEVQRYRKATAAVARVLDLARVDGKL